MSDPPEPGYFERDLPFQMVPLGPQNAEDGRWCCGLYCGKPCPYGLRIRPGGRGQAPVSQS